MATVADALLDELAAQGVAVCFGVPGVHNLPFWAGAGAAGRPRIVGVRHEGAAGYAADAAARTTGGLGVALTTTGPGFANALAAFGEAYASFSPVLLISSETPLGRRRTSGHDDGLLHGMRSQAAAVEHGFGARAVSATSGEEALAALVELAGHARRTGRPAYLGVPSDVLAEQYAGRTAAPADAPTAAVAGDVARAASLLSGASVVLWAGARAVPAQAQVRALAQLLGARVVTTFQARGLLADLPGAIVAPPHEPRVAEAVAAADVLLVVGDDLHGMTTRNWSMPLPPVLVAVTDDEHASLGDYDLAVRITGDIATCVSALQAALGGATAREAPTDDLTARVLADTAEDPRCASGLALVRTVEHGWPDDGALVLDMCVAGYWLAGYSAQPRPRRLVYPVGWGTLGFGLPAAIGPAALGTPTLAVVGDGGAAMALGELATYVQERLPVVLLVVSDGGYGMLRYDQDVAGDEHRGVDLLEPRWSDIAAAYGMSLLRTDDAGAGLAAALTSARTAVARGEQPLIVLDAALMPPRTTSPRWREA
jgi:acetolactate synthase-1/2/3 large subunit